MAVNTGTWFLETTGDGSTTSFLCAFPVMRLADIWVYVDDVLQTANRDYSITGAVKNDRNSIDAGWSVVFTEAPADEAVVYIRRKTPRHNSNKLYKGDKFSLPVFENNYDNITMMYQELGGLIIDGYQGPIAENIPPQDYNPTLSGFYPCKIVDGPNGSSFTIRSVVPTPEGGWNTVSYPVLDETAADINNRTNYSLNDIVLAKPIADSNGDVAWRFVGNESCSSTAEPPYSGTYYEVARCDNLTVDEVAWVRADEFSTGQSFVRYGVCYSVLGSGTPPLNSLVIRASEVTTYSNCTNCTTANPNSPDTETPPFPASRYRKMENCDDQTRDEYSIPTEFFGVPTNHDLTKTYGAGGKCYIVSDEEEASPSNPLIPTQNGEIYDDCIECNCTAATTTPCGFCPDFTPLNLTITFSGIQKACPAGCYSWGGIGVQTIYNQIPNGTFQLTQDTGAGNCYWRTTLTNPVTTRTWNNTDCTSDRAGGTGDMIMQVRRSLATIWRVEIFGFIQDAITGGSYDGFTIFDSGNITVPSSDPCGMNGLVINNALTSSLNCWDSENPVTGGTDLVVGINGQATIVCG